ncbi:hypothetical protein VTP01DRAFT_1385 [Rhizomucor pusillus]|uniref:uncharacterized protein n=1 Tax=Rhizomucor pusillus TaxID=4840 RepID=UPI0037441D7F
MTKSSCKSDQHDRRLLIAGHAHDSPTCASSLAFYLRDVQFFVVWFCCRVNEQGPRRDVTSFSVLATRYRRMSLQQHSAA